MELETGMGNYKAKINLFMKGIGKTGSFVGKGNFIIRKFSNFKANTILGTFRI